MATIGLVTVLYKSDDVLADFFKSIAHQTYQDFILYLVDNSVSDATNKLLNGFYLQYPNIRYKHTQNAANVGVAAGNNIGIHQALADGCSHILILNNDIDFEQTFMFEKLMHITTTTNAPIITPKIFYYTNPNVWMAGGYMDKYRALGVHYGMDKPDGTDYNTSKFITYAPTCFMLVDAKVFASIGFMDEKYFVYYDDTDFVYRALQAGFKLWYEASLTLRHKVSSSTGTNSPLYVYYSNRNKIYFIKKNLRSFVKLFATFYTLLSRCAFYLKYDKVKKQKLVQGLKDGFALQVD